MKEVEAIVKEWIDKADHDLGSAKLIYLHIPDYFDTIAFLCQQATEKYIKSLLVHLRIEFKRSHNLIYLLDLLTKKMDITKGMYEKATLLNGFSVQIRYPDNKILLSKEELETSIIISQEFRSFAFKTIGITEEKEHLPENDLNKNKRKGLSI
jgi:HEPN domain-containing protein